MAPTWNDYRKVIARNGFVRERVKKHETWIKRDAEGRIERSTRASKGGGEISDKGLFARLLRQCGKTKEHFEEVLKG